MRIGPGIILRVGLADYFSLVIILMKNLQSLEIIENFSVKSLGV